MDKESKFRLKMLKEYSETFPKEKIQPRKLKEFWKRAKNIGVLEMIKREKENK